MWHRKRTSVLALVALTALACSPDDYPTDPRFDPPIDEVELPDGELFFYEPPAGLNVTSVAVAGEFNGWNNTANMMQELPDGRWVAGIELEEGEYLYKYVINGNWVGNMCNDATYGNPDNDGKVDPEVVECVDDGFGGANGVRVVGPPGHLFLYNVPAGVDVDSVFVAGSFSDPQWTPALNQMQEIWTVTVEDIPAGTYMYKYVFNGDQWASNMCADPTWGGDLDPDIEECNPNDNNNGVLVMEEAGSHTFRYIAPAGIDPDSISVAGNFVTPNWTPGVVDMQQTFRLNIELEPGTYEYKYVFNGDQWADNMCNDPTWGDPANGGKVDPNVTECTGAFNNGLLEID